MALLDTKKCCDYVRSGSYIVLVFIAILRPTKTRASLRICADSPGSTLVANTLWNEVNDDHDKTHRVTVLGRLNHTYYNMCYFHELPPFYYGADLFRLLTTKHCGMWCAVHLKFKRNGRFDLTNILDIKIHEWFKNDNRTVMCYTHLS